MSCTAGVSHYGFVPLCGNPLPDSEVRAPRTGYGNDPTFHYEPIVGDFAEINRTLRGWKLKS